MPLFRQLWLLMATILLLLTLLLGVYAERLQQMPTLDPVVSQLLVDSRSAAAWQDVAARRASFARLINETQPIQLTLYAQDGEVLERFPPSTPLIPTNSSRLKLPVPLPDGEGRLEVVLTERTLFGWWRWWLALAGVWAALTLLSGWGLWRLLRGVREVREVAQRIIDGERDPVALNIQSSYVTGAAIQRLLNEVQQMAKAQVTAIDQVRRRSFVDSHTGLGNRAYFDAHLDVLLNDRDANVTGTIVLFDVGEPFEDGSAQQQFVEQLVVLIQHHLREFSHAILARRDDNNFAALLPGINARDMDTFCRKLLRETQVLVSGLKSAVPDARCLHMGVVSYRSGDEAYHRMAEADMALRFAQQQSHQFGWHMFEQGEIQPSSIMGRVRWRSLLERVIEQRKTVFHYHPVVLGHERRIAFYEVLSRVPGDQGELFTAATFLPMAHRVGLAVAFDRQVCDRVLKALLFGPQQSNMLSINLSSDAVHDHTFRQWLLEHLAENRPLAERVVFEVGEHIASHLNADVLGFLEALNACGCSLAVEHVGQPQYSANYLRPGLYRFVKLHRSLTRDIETDAANQDFVRGLAAVASATGAIVLAENVETEAQWQKLLTLGVHGGQGYLFGQPSAQIGGEVSRSA